MTNYVFTYPQADVMPEDPAAIAEVMAAWSDWFASLGESLVDGGAPFGSGAVLAGDSSTTAGAAPLGGYSVVQAADLDAAIALATGCPIHQHGAPISVYEAIAM